MSPTLLAVIAHGARIGWISVALAAVLGFALAPRASRAIRRLRARAALRALGEPLPSVPAGESVPAVLSGVLQCDADAPFAVLSCARPNDDGTDTVHTSDLARGLVLVVGEHRIRVDGLVEVTHGHANARGPVDTTSHTGEGRNHKFVYVYPGDRVRVAAVVEPLANTDHDAGYRGARPTWKLRPGATGRILVALEDSPGASLPTAWRALASVGAAAAWSALATLAGLALLASGDGARGPIESAVLRSVCAGGGQSELALASAVPWLRARALDRLAVTLQCASERTRDTIHALREVHDALRTPCAERATRFESLTDYEHAADAWARCNTADGWRHASRLYLSLGRFREASDARAHLPLDPADLDAPRALRTHLLARQHRRAAAVARAIGEERLRIDAARPGASTMAMLCADAALRALAGDASGATRLRELMQQEALLGRGDACAMLSAWSGDRATRDVIAGGFARTWSGGYGLSMAPAMLRASARVALAAVPSGALSREPIAVIREWGTFSAHTGALDDAQRALDALRDLAAHPELHGLAEPACAQLDAELTMARRGPDACATDAAPSPAQMFAFGVFEQSCADLRAIRDADRETSPVWRAFGLDTPGTLPSLLRGDRVDPLRDALRGVHHEEVRDRTRVVFVAAALHPAWRPVLARWLTTEAPWAVDDHATVLRALISRRAAARALGDETLVREIDAILRRHREALVDDDLAVVWHVISRHG